MKKIVFISILLLSMFHLSLAQQRRGAESRELKFPLTADYWEHDPENAVFTEHRGVPAVRPVEERFFNIKLKDYKFINGTIEFDVELIGRGFPGITFRMSEDDKFGENFYIRSFGPVSDDVRTTVQYAAIIDGVSMWDMTDEYQGGAEIFQEGWNHVKLVVSSNQLEAFVNNMDHPALSVPALEGERGSGTISLNGNVIYANFSIRPNETARLSSLPGYISTSNDTRYLRNWEVTEAMEFPLGKDIVLPMPGMFGKVDNSIFPDSTTQWTPIQAEKRAVVNLSRKFGFVENEYRRLAWLKTTIHSDKDQDKVLNLGFSDEVWVVINGQILYTDKNYFGGPVMKFPKGRCTIENSGFTLPLKEGDNELIIGLAHYFYGWGLIARLNDMAGLDLP